jgi:precorrin-6B methylase 2
MPGQENLLNPEDIQFTSKPTKLSEPLPPAPEMPANFLSPKSKPEDEVLVILDPEKNISITAGVPLESEVGANFKVIAIPDSPHVFVVHELTFFQKSDESLQVINNVPIIFGHAIRTINSEGKEDWRFVGGAGVVETIQALDKFCRENRLPKVEVVAACNAQHQDDESEVAFADFDHDRQLVQVIREKPNIPANQARLFPNGATRMRIEANSFVYLDELVLSHEVQFGPDTNEIPTR